MAAIGENPEALDPSDRCSPPLAWTITALANIASLYAFEIFTGVAGAALAASGQLAGLEGAQLLWVLAASYLFWGVGLRANLGANIVLLRSTGASTCAVSKAAFDLARRWRWSSRAEAIAANAAYVGVELAKEAPYYAAAFGAAALSGSVSATDAVVFIVGTNLAAGACEYFLARASYSLLRYAPRIAQPTHRPGYGET